jgi:hypothetical protein
VGGLAIRLTSLGMKTGMPMALLFGTLFASFQVQSASCDFAEKLQIATGLLCLLVGVLRYSNKFLEASLMTSLMAGTYVSSSLCAASFGDNGFDSVAFSILLIVTWCAWWAFTAWQFRGYWHEVGMSPSSSLGGRPLAQQPRYSVVLGGEDDLEIQQREYEEEEAEGEDDGVRDPFNPSLAVGWSPATGTFFKPGAATAADKLAGGGELGVPLKKSAPPAVAARPSQQASPIARQVSGERPIYVAIHEFTAESNDELNLQVNERVALVQLIDQDWMVALNTRGSLGLVPMSYVKPEEALTKLPPSVEEVVVEDATEEKADMVEMVSL